MRLITEIPLSGLSDQVRTLRSTLLRGTAHSVELEEEAIRGAKQLIAQSLPALFRQFSAPLKPTDTKFEELSPTVRLELGIWLRQQVAQYVEFNER